MSALHPQIIEQASQWLVEFATGEPEAGVRREFDAWLRQSPEHVRAYLELLPIWKQAASARFALDTGPEALIAHARTEDNVVAFGPAVRRSPGTRVSDRRRLFAVAAAAVAVVGIGLVSYAYYGSVTYTTGVGEQHSVVLPDGSTLQLNARSKVRARFSERQRLVELVQGQALFQVEADSARPFVVNVGATSVRALGTQFDVYRKQGEAVVTVVQGKVAVAASVSKQSLRGSPEQGRASPSPISILSAGEQMVVSTKTPLAITGSRPANLSAATAWTQRRLVFDASSLAEVVQEFNRYNARPLVLLDPALGEFPITGTFSSTNPAPLLLFLKAQAGIRVIEAQDEIQIEPVPRAGGSHF